MNEKLAHLQMIQGVINRLSGNSFMIKGWVITLVSAILALTAKSEPPISAWIAAIPVFLFWILDGYFLALERRFRRLFDAARTSAQAVDFSMDISGFEAAEPWHRGVFAGFLITFYFTLLALVSVVVCSQQVA